MVIHTENESIIALFMTRQKCILMLRSGNSLYIQYIVIFETRINTVCVIKALIYNAGNDAD